MENNRRFEIPADVIDEVHFHPAIDQHELFGPVARKAIFIIFVVMFAIIVLAILVSYPLTLIPFGIILYAFHQYRKITKNPYRKRRIFSTKKH